MPPLSLIRSFALLLRFGVPIHSGSAFRFAPVRRSDSLPFALSPFRPFTLSLIRSFTH
ncbi:hypothetical protein [Spirosoma spitsbergense]|uniref:hypothetical protein n=1 Tax=Spirosoma spitsbergense TaxID=431554 RepID=UPI0012F82E5C|nr:hypothetical protein [Spirosoma spitsbergense]